MKIEFEEAKQLFLNIYNDKELANLIEQYSLSHKAMIVRCLKAGLKKRWNTVLRKNAFEKLCICVCFLPIAKDKYVQLGISDKIFFDTMHDIAVWIDDCKHFTGKAGLDEMNWIVNHLNIEIFQLGRLQFQLSKYYFSLKYDKGDTHIKYGEKCLNMHIPRGGAMTPERVADSIAIAKSFFKKHFSNYPTYYVICHSWLFYSGNKNFVDEKSNIARFVERFETVGQCDAPAQTFRWLFSYIKSDVTLIAQKVKSGNYCDLSQLPQDTAMQKRAVEYLKNGGKFGDGKAIALI